MSLQIFIVLVIMAIGITIVCFWLLNFNINQLDHENQRHRRILDALESKYADLRCDHLRLVEALGMVKIEQNINEYRKKAD